MLLLGHLSSGQRGSREVAPRNRLALWLAVRGYNGDPDEPSDDDDGENHNGKHFADLLALLRNAAGVGMVFGRGAGPNPSRPSRTYRAPAGEGVLPRGDPRRD
jgi:hypothetical protein